MNPKCEVYREGVRMEELSLPAGQWVFVDTENFVRLSGERFGDVLGTSEVLADELHLNLDEGTYERVPTPMDVEFLFGGASAAVE